MPRLTAKTYLEHRLLLMVEWWDHQGGAFLEISLPQQRDLHDYYAPAEPLTDEQALAHRAAMTEAFPALPQKAGRAMQALIAARDAPPRQHDRSRSGPRIVTVKVLARPQIDVQKLARLFARLAYDDPSGELLKRMKSRRRRR